jgi:hypothetical protein
MTSDYDKKRRQYCQKVKKKNPNPKPKSKPVPKPKPKQLSEAQQEYQDTLAFLKESIEYQTAMYKQFPETLKIRSAQKLRCMRYLLKLMETYPEVC